MSLPGLVSVAGTNDSPQAPSSHATLPAGEQPPDSYAMLKAAMAADSSVVPENTGASGEDVEGEGEDLQPSTVVELRETEHEVSEHGESDEHGEHGEESFGEIVLHHLTSLSAVELPSFRRFTSSIPLDKLQFSVLGIDMSITKPVLFLWLAALIVLLAFTLSFRGGRLMRNKFAQLLEVYVLFIRNEVVYPNLGEKDGRRLLPFLLTVFFFILACNLLGLIPWGSTATGNVNVTAGLAIVAFIAIQGQGIRKHGVLGHFKGMLPSGLPTFVIPIMIPVEIVGTFAKPFALCIRLFANMVAGHAVIIVLLVLIIQGGFLIAPLPVAGVLFISMLELFVAHLQAFIFTILTTLFISMALHPGH